MKTLFNFITLLTLTAFCHAADKNWSTDLKEAQELAQKESKILLIKFTGSDWCKPCMMIDEAVFSKEEFTTYATEKFILCIIDIPQGDKDLAEKNKPILEKFKVMGFPTVVLVDASEGEFFRFNPTDFETVNKMKEQLDLQIKRKDMF